MRITPEGVGADSQPWNGVYNPSFDVTPADLISESTTFTPHHGREDMG